MQATGSLHTPARKNVPGASGQSYQACAARTACKLKVGPLVPRMPLERPMHAHAARTAYAKWRRMPLERPMPPDHTRGGRSQSWRRLDGLPRNARSATSGEDMQILLFNDDKFPGTLNLPPTVAATTPAIIPLLKVKQRRGAQKMLQG